MAQPFLVVILLCSAHLASGARIHKGSGSGSDSKSVEECRSAGDKSQIASCVCKLANGAGLSPKSVAEECAGLRMTAMRMALPEAWSCALRKGPETSTCGAMHPWRVVTDTDTTPVVEERVHEPMSDELEDDDLLLDDLDVLEDDEELEEVLEEEDVPDVVPKEKFREEVEKCRGLPTKTDRATCACDMAKGNGLTAPEVVDRCKALRMLAMRVAMPWSCQLLMTGAKAKCHPMYPWRPGGGKTGPALPIVVEKRQNDGGGGTTKDDLDEVLDLEEVIDLDCAGAWSAWGACSAECGSGTRSRSYSVTTAASGGGTACPTGPDSEACNTQGCPVACVGSWSSWGGCSAQCGGGTRSRSYSVTTAAFGGGTACPSGPNNEACNAHDCPVACVGSWSAWGGCSAQCGGGMRFRSYSVTTDATGGGTACPTGPVFEDCNTHGCPPVHCRMQYVSQSGCSRGCGGGQVATHFRILTHPSNGGNPCHATTRYHSCNNHGCKDDCFPADALVETPAGPTRMSELRVGDAVRSVDGAGLTFFDKVYFFGHADGSRSAQYVDLKLADEQASLQLSGRHFLPTCPEKNLPCDWAQHIHVYAKDVLAGDYIWTAPSAEASSSGGQIALRMVLESSTVVREGLYNPYTLSGKVVVNGAVASAHSEWILDDWSPESLTQYLPAVYQVVFLPGRWLYHLVGPAAADVLDVNNPQIAAQKHGHGPEFLAACAMVSLSVMLLVPFKRWL